MRFILCGILLIGVTHLLKGCDRYLSTQTDQAFFLAEEFYEEMRASILCSDRLTTNVKMADMDEILPGLYLGNKNAFLGVSNKFSHVISCGTSYGNPVFNFPLDWMHIPIVDGNFDIKQYFEQAFNFIEKTKKCILIHCFGGISRSSTIVIAYIMRKFRVSYDSAYRFVFKKRSLINPNEYFKKQLQEYEQELMNAGIL